MRLPTFRRAIQDVAEIRRYSRTTWGREQAKRYMLELNACVERVAAATAVATTVNFGPHEFSRSRCQEHLIYFLESGERGDREDHVPADERGGATV
jgi:plasmid stabilization system protein ParE